MRLVSSEAICSCVFRLKDDWEVNEWFDILGRHAVPGEQAIIGGDEYQKSFYGKVAGLEIYHCILHDGSQKSFGNFIRKFHFFPLVKYRSIVCIMISVQPDCVW